MSNKVFLFVLILVFLPAVLGAYVNSPVDVQVKLQYDDGMTLSDVTTQACVISVFDFPLDDFVVKEQDMVNGSTHHYNFTPTNIGAYGISVKCDYNSESATYYETINVENPPSPSSYGTPSGTVVALNGEIFPEKDNFNVDLGRETKLSFWIKYYLDGVPAVSNSADYKIYKDDKVLQRGGFLRNSDGSYQFAFDFKDYVDGDYNIMLTFDGKSKVVDVHIGETSKNFAFLSMFFMNSDGSLNIIKTVLSVIGVLFFIIIFMVAVMILTGKGRRK